MKTQRETLRLDYEPVGNNGRISVRVTLGDDVLALDKLDVLSASARSRFTRGLCKDRPGIDPAEVEQQLLSIAREIQERKQAPAQSATATELDVSRIVRPERFITPEVSGLGVAIPTLCDGRPAGRWMLYLRWADGRREAMELPDSLVLSDGGKLWIHPTPGEPSVRQVPAWTEADRKAWLAGSEPPDPAEVFQRLCKCIAHFIDFPSDRAPGMAATLALWAMLTYAYPAWPAIPYLYLGGPMGSGKTRVFEVLSRLVFRPLQSSNMTGAALFRTLHSRGGTLLYDEAERLKQSTPDVGEINSMLLAGYKSGGRATRLEPVGDTFRTVEFDVFGPKALACVRGLPEALSSRCIPVMMFRAGKDSPKPRRHIDGQAERWRTLRADLHAMALEYGPDFLDLAARGHVCPAMSGRQYELWQPLLALASWVEDHGAKGLLALMQGFATASNESAEEEQTPDCDEVLLRALAELVRAGQSPIAKEVLEKAQQEEPRMFANWSAKGAANALRRYGIETRKTHGRRSYGHVTLADIRRIQATYNMDLGLPDAGNGENTPENVPHVPQVPQGHPEGAVGASAGAHGVCRAHGALAEGDSHGF